MTKMGRIAFFFAGIGLGILSIVSFNDCFTDNFEECYESKSLRNLSSYVKRYEGQEPQNVLDYAGKIFETTRQFKPVQIEGLEREILETSIRIGDRSSPKIYKPMFQNFGEKIAGVSENIKLMEDDYQKSRRSGSFIGGIIAGLGALTSIYFGFLFGPEEKIKYKLPEDWPFIF